MQRTVRAAGSAAALIFAAASASFAAPSIASEAQTAPAIHYSEHAGASIDASDLGLNGADAPAPQSIQLASTPDLSVPVATHAVAEAVPVTAPPVAAEAEDEPAPQVRRSLAERVRE